MLENYRKREEFDLLRLKKREQIRRMIDIIGKYHLIKLLINVNIY